MQLDKAFYAKLLRRMPTKSKYLYLDDHRLEMKNVTVKIVKNLDGKFCLSYKSPDGRFECLASSPIVTLEKLDNGCKIVTYCGMEYLLLAREE